MADIQVSEPSGLSGEQRPFEALQWQDSNDEDNPYVECSIRYRKSLSNAL